MFLDPSVNTNLVPLISFVVITLHTYENGDATNAAPGSIISVTSWLILCFFITPVIVSAYSSNEGAPGLSPNMHPPKSIYSRFSIFCAALQIAFVIEEKS